MLTNKTMNGEELMNLANLLAENGYDRNDLTVVIEVEDENELKRVNDDFYYRFKDGNEDKTDNVNEINIYALGVKFKYKVKEKP